LLPFDPRSGGHGNILRLERVCEDEHLLYFVLELCPGGDLFDRVQKEASGRLPEAKARQYFLQLLQGVCFLHGRGIIHRDLSLENAMVDGNDTVKLIDFGLSVDRWYGGPPPPGLMPAGGKVGKPSYMDPLIFAN